LNFSKPPLQPKIVWDVAETRGGKRKGTDLFERRRQLCDQVIASIFRNFELGLSAHNGESAQWSEGKVPLLFKNRAIKQVNQGRLR